MATNIVNDVVLEELQESVVESEEYIGCSIGIMAYNEEANIARTLQSVLEQTGPTVRIEEVIVVASPCAQHDIWPEFPLRPDRVSL